MFSVLGRSALVAPTTRSARRRIRAAVERIEARILLSSYTVNTFVDQVDPAGSHTVSLRDAIAGVTAHGGTINLPAGMYPLTHGQLFIDNTPGAVTINSVGGVAVIDAGKKSRVLQVGANADLAVKGVTFTHGVADTGGGIENDGTLTLTDCTISGNTATGNAENAANGGGIQGNNVLTVIGCTISGNSAIGSDTVGGGIGGSGFVLKNCTIAGNSATSGGGIYGGNVTIEDCTISNNSASAFDGGVLNYTYGNSTVINNIIAGNHAPSSPDTDGPFSSGGHNLLGFSNPLTPLVDPRLAPLGNYGGPTQTMVPLAGSPALGMGDPSVLPGGLTVDQRNLPRVVNGRMDIGAVQTQPPAKIHVSAPASQSFAAGSKDAVNLGSFTGPAGSGPFTVGVDWNDGSPVTFLSFAAPGSLGTASHTFARGATRTPTLAITDRFGDLSNEGTFNVVIRAAAASSYIVNTPLDQTHAAGSSLLSLRDAINRADKNLGPVSISFDPTVFASHRTIVLNGTMLELSNSFGPLTIIGPANGVTISGSNNSRVMQIDTAVVASIQNIALTDANATSPNSTTFGAGLYNAGTVTLTTVTVANNTGGAGAGIENQGSLTINYSLIDSNSAPNGGDGAGIDNSGALTLNYSTISGNTNTGGNGAGLNNTGVASILGSTFAQNQGVQYYRQLYGDYGGAINNSGNLTLTNSTLSGNSAAAGGGIENSGTARIAASTITKNDALGGGIRNEKGASLTLGDSIIATNTQSDDVSGTIISLGHNLIGDVIDVVGNDVSKRWLASDLQGTDAHPLDPRLSPLDFYGGPTQTQFPLAGSPAIGAGAASLLPAGTTKDQRGFARVVNGVVDIGSVELQRAATLTVNPPAKQNVVAGIATTVQLGSFTTSAGRAPFHVVINWGDGSANSYFTDAKTGSIGSFTHTFVKTGSLTGTISVRDNQGDISQFTSFSIAAAPHPLVSLTVNTTKDQADPAGSKTLSLRDALTIADQSYGPVNIRFDSTVFGSAKTITLNAGLSLSHNLFGLVSIAAPSTGITIQGNATDSDLSIGKGVSASLSHINFTNAGQTGIVNDGTTTLADCTISNNHGADGGGIGNGGSMTLTRCTIDDNAAITAQGGRGSFFGGNGGGIANQGTMTVTDSTISGNTADNTFESSDPGDAIYNDGTLTLRHTSVPGDPSVEILNFGKLTQTP